MEEFVVVLFSSVKFAFVFPLAILKYKFSFFETILWTNIGAALGVVTFAYFSNLLSLVWFKIVQWLRNSNVLPPAKDKKRFNSKKKRSYVKLKKYGFYGLAIITPVIISIPIGSFLMMRFYPRRKRKIITLIISHVSWSFILTTILFLIKYKVI